MLTTQEAAYELVFNHDSEMARESGSPDAGADGWDGMLINADMRFVREAFGWIVAFLVLAMLAGEAFGQQAVQDIVSARAATRRAQALREQRLAAVRQQAWQQQMWWLVQQQQFSTPVNIQIPTIEPWVQRPRDRYINGVGENAGYGWRITPDGSWYGTGRNSGLQWQELRP